MPSRKYKTPIEILTAKGRQIIKMNDDARFQHRVEMVNLVLAGMPPSQLSEVCKESKNTITLWVKIADEQGFEALRIKKQPGRPKKLDDEMREQVKSVLIEDDPEKYGYSVWDGPSLKDFIGKRYNVEYSVRQCQRLMHRLGFALVRPQTFPGKGADDKDIRDNFKKN